NELRSRWHPRQEVSPVLIPSEPERRQCRCPHLPAASSKWNLFRRRESVCRRWRTRMEDNEDPLARFGLDAIDLRWTMKDIAAKRWFILNQAHVSQLIELGLVEMRGGRP